MTFDTILIRFHSVSRCLLMCRNNLPMLLYFDQVTHRPFSVTCTFIPYHVPGTAGSSRLHVSATRILRRISHPPMYNHHFTWYIVLSLTPYSSSIIDQCSFVCICGTDQQVLSLSLCRSVALLLLSTARRISSRFSC